MIETKAFVLISTIVHFVLVVVLEGILITEFYKRKEKFGGGILVYGIFLIVILAFSILDIYRNLISASTLLNWINLSLATLANILFIGASLKYFKYINKKLFFSIPLFSISIVIIEVLRLLGIGRSLEMYTAITTLTATTLAYFVIVGFLINSSGGKNEKI